MIRTPKIVDKVWPWFRWRTCAACGLEFRREPGWRYRKATGRTVYDDVTTKAVFLCNACAPMERDAINAVFDLQHHPKDMNKEEYLELVAAEERRGK